MSDVNTTTTDLDVANADTAPIAVELVAEPAAPTPAFVFSSIAAPFTAEGDKVKVSNALLLRHVGNITVLSNTARKSIKTEATETFDNMLFELREAGRTVVRVNAFSDFFNGEDQFNKMVKADIADNAAFAESINLEMTQDELITLANYTKIKAKIEQFFTNVATGGYVFAPQPRPGISKMRVTAQTVTNNGGYTMTRTKAKAIFERARKLWQGEVKSISAPRHEHRYSRYGVTINATGINIGCQTITRWEVEQAALDMGLIEA